ncbi:glycosyltransferase family 2 protein [Noviherbaspirillum massiliense]|uniref:glycosyltransferase family 2 protein n=1 Tax=Noviherbaspirillum massiliense TaxID=1465823 RepID=UPI000946CC51|nr:glycosyltransferase family 2 protein [Noviherbaspirillum massiliense]
MSVTVIIVNWNSADLLSTCLFHLANQTIKPKQILVIDNASREDPSELAKKFPDVTVIRMKSNLGFAGANNVGLRLCNTEYVALLNPDAFPKPDWLEHLLEAAATHQNAAAFGSRQLCYERPEVLDGTGDSYNMSGRVRREGYGMLAKPQDLVSREIFSPCAAAALYRRTALLAIGGFDEDYFCYVEDVDVGFRLRLAGYKALYVPNAVVHHVGSASTGGRHSDFSVYHGHRNLVWTFIKNMPNVLFILLLPLHLLLNLISIFRFMLRGQGRLILRAKLHAIRGLPEVWAKRRHVQRTRVAKICEIWSALDKRLIPW